MGFTASTARTFPVALGRMPAIALLVAFYLVTYLLVTRVSARLPDSAVHDFSLPLDASIPYIPWTWPFYWMAYPFVIVGGAMVLMRLPPRAYAGAVRTVAAVTAVTSLVQLLVPSHAPWPVAPTGAQRVLHGAAFMLPYAAFPSMHVAYCALVSGFASQAPLGARWALAGWLVTGLVAVATLTQKEHYLLDVVAGLLLATAALAFWRRRVTASWA